MLMTSNLYSNSQPLQPVERITSKAPCENAISNDEMLQKMRDIGDHLSRSKSWLSQFESPKITSQR